MYRRSIMIGGYLCDLERKTLSYYWSFSIRQMRTLFVTILEPLAITQKRTIKSFRNRLQKYSITHNPTNWCSKYFNLHLFSQRIIVKPVEHDYQTRNASNLGVNVQRVVKSINVLKSFYLAYILYRIVFLLWLEIYKLKCGFWSASSLAGCQSLTR